MIGFYIVDEVIEAVIGPLYMVLLLVGALYLGKAIHAVRRR